MFVFGEHVLERDADSRLRSSVLGLGAVNGAVIGGINWELVRSPIPGFISPELWLPIAASFTIASVLISRRVGSGRAVSSLIQLLAVGSAVGLASWVVFSPRLLSRGPIETIGWWSLLSAAFFVIPMVLSLAGVWVGRRIAPGRIIEQSGVLCWACGYALHGLPSDTLCPECATPRGEGQRVTTLDRFRTPLRLIGKTCLWCFLLAAMIHAAWWGVEVYPIKRDLQRQGAIAFGERLLAASPVSSRRLMGSGFLPFDPDDSSPSLLGVFIVVASDGRWHQLQVARYVPPREGVSVDPFRSGTLAYSRLTDGQLAVIRGSGLPGGLVARLEEAARERERRSWPVFVAVDDLLRVEEVAGFR